MGNISATLSMSLDGVIQAPGRPDEGTRDGSNVADGRCRTTTTRELQRMVRALPHRSMLFGRRPTNTSTGTGRSRPDTLLRRTLSGPKYVVSNTRPNLPALAELGPAFWRPSGQCRRAQSRAGPRPGHRWQRPTGQLTAAGEADRPIGVAHAPARPRSRSPALR